MSERGFSTPTEPQRAAIPALADDEDALVVAPTGSGKAETAMLPVLSAIRGRENRFGVQALYVTPLRVLNRDMREDLDSGPRRSTASTSAPATPETMQAMFTGKRLRRALEAVEDVVVDEVRELAASRRGAQTSRRWSSSRRARPPRVRARG